MDFQNVKTASPTRLLLTRISAQAKRSSRPKAQLCRSAGREFLRSATPCAPPRMEVSKVYIGESARWRKSRNKGFGTHPESFVHIRCIFTVPLPVLNLKKILNVKALRVCAEGKLSKSRRIAFREEQSAKRTCIALQKLSALRHGKYRFEAHVHDSNRLSPLSYSRGRRNRNSEKISYWKGFYRLKPRAFGAGLVLFGFQAMGCVCISMCSGMLGSENLTTPSSSVSNSSVSCSPFDIVTLTVTGMRS